MTSNTQSYDNFSKTFSASRKSMKWPEMDYFMDFIKNKNIGNYKILDVGCGNGRLLNYLKQFSLDKFYLGIDESVGMINEAKIEHPGHNFEVLDMTNLDKLDRSFDFIFFIASFHHLKIQKERQEVLQKTLKILNKGGFIFMTNWNLLSPSNLKKYQETSKGSQDFNIKIGDFFRFYHGFKIEELDNLFKKEGFKIIENRVFEGERNIISILGK
ncbi:class I SAM-dependent methyltransferase [Candidatus Gracilibacteria bacterium]|nr:class I SAM-dependent methyltransferase [Candidatus Gracilibacteria bacterium]